MGQGEVSRLFNNFFHRLVAITHMHQSKTSRIPDLVYKIAITLYSVFIQLNLPPLGCKCRQGKTHCICAILGHYHQRIDDITCGF